MADLGKTDPVWLRFLKELFFFVRVARAAEDHRRRYTLERTQFLNMVDKNANFTTPHDGNTLSGVVFGVNTDDQGRLYVHISGGGPYTVSLYKATGGGGGDLVAQGSGNASATITLTAQNSSGLSGTVRLAASVTAESDDDHYLFVIADWKKETLTIWPSDGTTSKDASSRNAVGRMLIRANAAMGQLQDAIETGLEEWAIQFAEENEIPVQGRGNSFLEVSEAVLIGETEQRDESSGEVTRVRRGFFQILTAAMADETTGSTQDVVKRVVAASAGTFSSANVGAGTVAAHTPEGHCPIGRWTFRCVSGLGNGGGGAELFDGEFQSSIDDRTFTFRNLQIKADYKGPNGFGVINLVRSITKTGDGSNLMVGAASTFSTSGENEANTTSGVLYGKIVANGSNWDIEFYSTTNRNPGELVAKATNKATSATGVQATPQKGSNLYITFDVGSGPTNGDTFEIDLNYFSINNGSSGVASTPDSFYVDTTLTSTGVLANVLATLFGAYVNGDTSGSELISDDVAAIVNTFPPYAKLDI